jgi:Zn finger protein HypA/HybF involved in hydrogenase expression
LDQEIASAVKVFEQVEKIRRSCDITLSHLARNMHCPDCGNDWMPKRFESCPECGSDNTRVMKVRRKCLDCEHIWEPSGQGVCPHCGSSNSVSSPRTDAYIENIALPRLRVEEEFYEGQLIEMVKEHTAWKWASNVKGAGLTTIGRLIGKTDIQRLKTVSAMWAHCGFGLYPDGTRQRKRKGEKIDYDTQLQSNCVILGESLLRQKDSYYDYYIKEKDKFSDLSDGHRHNRAFRHMIKLFLSHFWQTWREAEGLPAPPPYAFDILNHPAGHYIRPDEMVKQPAKIRQR